MRKRGLLIVISAPSGCGKSTVISELLKADPHLHFSVSVTTRGPRGSEQDGKDYFFVSNEEFLRLVEKDEMLEHACYVGNYYGTPKQPIFEKIDSGTDVVLEIEVNGAEQVKRRYPNALLIFILPPSFEELMRRLVDRRTDSPEVIEKRMQKAKSEMQRAKYYDYLVVNDDLSTAVSQIQAILTAEKLRNTEKEPLPE